MKKLLALTLILGCFPLGTTPSPLRTAQINPPGIYQTWGQAAINCAVDLKAKDSTVAYTIEHDSLDINNLNWFIVATEDSNGGFNCRVKSCAGEFFPPDTILLSAQFIMAEWTVKHEVMHWAVKSNTESQIPHELPWGLCEYLP